MVNKTDKKKIVWIVVAAGFHKRGGMDKANYAWAEFLAGSQQRVHLVAHDCDESLAELARVSTTIVAKPLNSLFLGEFGLDRAGRAAKRRFEAEGYTVCLVANGSNCLEGDVNWVHYVHAAWEPKIDEAPLSFRVRNLIQQRIALRRERIAFQRAKIIITNSHLTKKHVETYLHEDCEKVRTVYLGADAMDVPEDDRRAAAKKSLNIPQDRLVAAFVGGLGLDSRKGFDTIVKSWEILRKRTQWDVTLLVAGAGPALEGWKAAVAKKGLSDSIRFLGFCDDVESVLAASDLLLSPVRYEPYGLNIQEALTCGLAVLTSASAGVAERFPNDLYPLLLRNPENAHEYAERLLLWRRDPQIWRQRFQRFGDELRHRTWKVMAEDMLELLEAQLSTVSDREMEQTIEYLPA
jgi:glycosyltransferase involved in cell wall biosynthesis